MLSQQEKENIEKAVVDFEKATSAEIVPVISKRSDDYSETYWKSALLFGMLYFLIRIALFLNWYDISMNPLYEGAIFTGACMIGVLLVLVAPFYKRWITGKNKLEEQSQSEASKAFLDNEVFKTTRRTGILIYVSKFEHQVAVLGDSGINEKVKEEEWNEVVSLIVQNIKKKQLANGIIEAISKSKELLIAKGLAETDPNAPNTLSDSPVINS